MCNPLLPTTSHEGPPNHITSRKPRSFHLSPPGSPVQATLPCIGESDPQLLNPIFSYKTTYFRLDVRFCTSQVVVWDFFHQQYFWFDPWQTRPVFLEMWDKFFSHQISFTKLSSPSVWKGWSSKWSTCLTVVALWSQMCKCKCTHLRIWYYLYPKFLINIYLYIYTYHLFFLAKKTWCPTPKNQQNKKKTSSPSQKGFFWALLLRDISHSVMRCISSPFWILQGNQGCTIRPRNVKR